MPDECPPTDCPVCMAKTLGARLIRDVTMGKTTPYVVATKLNCSYEQVMEHINKGHEFSCDENGNLQSQDILLKKLADNLNTLDEWVYFVIQSVDSPNKIDNAKVNMLVKLTQEIRKTVESVGTLQGRMGPNDTVLQLQVVNNKVMYLTNAIASDCCPECRKKALQILENMDRIGGDEQWKQLPNVESSPEKLLTEKTTCSTCGQ